MVGKGRRTRKWFKKAATGQRLSVRAVRMTLPPFSLADLVQGMLNVMEVKMFDTNLVL